MQNKNWGLLDRVIAATAVTILVLSSSILSSAQREDTHAILAAAPRIPTSVKGVTVFAPPPEGFNPLIATNVELLTYGLPQRPDKVTNAKGYEQWERAMLAIKIHATGVEERPYATHNMAPAGPPATASADGTTMVGSGNWSGVANTNKLKVWNDKTSFNQVVSVWNAPAAGPPFGSPPCKDGPWFEVTWNGIGGYAANDSLVQGGSAAYWDGGTCGKTIEYYGWVEWFPSYNILPLDCGKVLCPVNPGDDFYVISYGAAGTAEQFVFVEDITQQWSAMVGLNYVSGPGLIGASAEYIAERPGNGTGYYPLGNYVFEFFNDSYAYDGAGTLFYPGSTAATTVILTMYADDGSTAISYPTYGSTGNQGRYSIWIQDENCAYKGGCTP